MKTEQLTKNFYIFALVLFAAKLWLVSAHYLQGTPTPHDDLLFARQAMSIASGDWLGAYDQFTLIKGPFYPLLIAISYWLAIPWMASQQILWAIASLVFVVAIYPAIKNQKLACLIFLFFLLNPFTYFYQETGRLFREAVYATLGLLSLSCFCGLLIRESESLRKKLLWASGGGLSFAAFWHTREESIWLIPTIVLVFGYHLYLTFKQNDRAEKLKTLALVYLAPLCIFALVTLGLRYENYKHYGLFMTIEVESAPFESAYGGLLRIKTDQWRQFFPVVRDARMKAYAISPSFKELEPFIEGEMGQGWMKMGWSNDLAAAFFIWVFRDATALAGHYKSSADAMAFYNQIGKEIDQACEAGKLECYPRTTNLIPRWHEEYNKLFFPTLWKTIKRIIKFKECSASTEGIYSFGKSSAMELFATVSREKLRTSNPKRYRELVPPFHLELDNQKIEILNTIRKFYRSIVRVLFIGGLLCLVASLVFSLKFRTAPRWPTIFSLGCLGGIVSLSVILTLVEITSYSEIVRAMQAAYPMVLFFIVSSIYEGFQLWGRRKERCSSGVE